MELKKVLKAIIRLSKEREMIPVERIVDNKNRFDGKVALIAGGSGGIGLSIAEKLLSCGCKVIIAGTNLKKVTSIKTELNTTNVDCIQLNYLNIDEFDKKVKEAADIFGKIDIYISSVGIHVDRCDLDFLNTTEDEYDIIMNTNLKGTYFMCQRVAIYMMQEKIKGHILLISSQSALEPSWSPYRLSKLGIDGITKGIAQRLIKYGIVVNAIGPGPTATAMQKNYDGKNIYTELDPIKRYTMPEEIAEVAAMLVSNIGDTIVGDTLYMSGGRGIIEIR